MLQDGVRALLQLVRLQSLQADEAERLAAVYVPLATLANYCLGMSVMFGWRIK